MSNLLPQTDLAVLRNQAVFKKKPLLCVVQTTENMSVAYACTTGAQSLKQVNVMWIDNKTGKVKSAVGASAQEKLYGAKFKANTKSPGKYSFRLNVIEKLNEVRAAAKQPEIKFVVKVDTDGVPTLYFIDGKVPYAVGHVIMDIDFMKQNVRKFIVHGCHLKTGEAKEFTIDVPETFVKSLNLGLADMQ